ncbi:MAG: tetratricopeptide repeat protein [Candidatus Lokiarchaeia archaeon]|nr:tetratricopeptide repeat protein [Candidatus Lokiarchaeia archaeon]
MENEEKKSSYKLPEALIQADNLKNSCKFNEALLLLNNLEEKENLKGFDLLSCHLLQSFVLNRLGNYQESYRVGEKAYQESKNLQSHLHTIDAIVSMSYALVWLGDFKRANDLILEGENILNSQAHEFPMDIEHKKGTIYYVKSNLKFFEGDMQKALLYAQDSLKIHEKYGDSLKIVESLNAVAICYGMLKLDLNTALKYAERCQLLAKQINHQQVIHFNYMNLGIIYTNKGEFEKAINNYKPALHYFEEKNEIQWLSATLSNIAIVHLHLGRYDEAVDYLKRGLKLSEKLGNSWFIAQSLVNIIEAVLLKGDIDTAKEYLERLKHLNEQENNKWIEMEYLASKAFILGQSPRIQSRAEAQKILKELIQRDLLPNLDVNLDNLVKLCELLLDELRITNDISVLDDLNPYIEQLIDLAKKTNSYWVLTETYILQAKLALLTLDLNGARRLLTQAQHIAEKHGMQRLATKVSFEHDELLQKLRIWEKLKDTESSLSERFKLTEVTKQMETMVQKRRNEIPEIIDENPIMLLVISTGGILTFSMLFAESFNVEDELISGFLSAFNSFSGELFSEGLDRASFGKYTLLMKPFSDFLICYIFKGQSFSALKKIQNFAENIEQNAELLEKFNNFYKTNQIINIEDVPQLNSLITKIFLEKFISE